MKMVKVVRINKNFDTNLIIIEVIWQTADEEFMRRVRYHCGDNSYRERTSDTT